MSETTNTTTDKQKEQKKSKNKKKSNIKIDKTSIIFFVITFIGILIFVIIAIYNDSKQIYTTQFGDNISSQIELKDDTIKLSIDVDGTKSIQTGTYELATDTDATYNVTFEDGTIAIIEITDDNTLIFNTNENEIIFNKQ